MRSPADEIVLVLFLIAAVTANLYTLFYFFRPWTTTAQGRALMVKSWGNVFLLNLGFCTLFFGYDFPGRDMVRVVGMSVFTIGLLYLLWTLLTSPGAEHYPPLSWLRRRR